MERDIKRMRDRGGGGEKKGQSKGFLFVCFF